MKNRMVPNFNFVPKVDIPRSQFNLSHGFKTTMNAGYLVPFFLDEALPGDTFNLKASLFARLATPIVPFMDNLYCDTFFFAVPYRLVWDNFQKFMGEQTDPGDSTDYLIPRMQSFPVNGYTTMSLEDYMGLPTGVPNYYHSSLWHRAYNLIWNEWFRDQDLQDSRLVPKGDGPDDPVNFGLARRNKKADYFTVLRPWPQKGPSVLIPMAESAPVVSNGFNPNVRVGLDPNVDRAVGAHASSNTMYIGGHSLGAQDTWKFGSQSGLKADLEDVSGTISMLRQAQQLQKLYERDAFGTRYTEIIRSHFGVVSPDARLQRPEYLGGFSTPINVHPIAQTSSSDSTTPQGNLAAMATLSASGHGFVKSFTEHCLIIGLVSIRADLNYQQGLHRMWSRRTKWDMYWPALNPIGQQATLKKELMLTNTSTDDEVLGYGERYAEYKYKPSLITGKFRSQDPQSLDIWHLAEYYNSVPSLNGDFISVDPPVDRVIATPDEPQFLFDAWFDFKATRPMPTYSTPGMLERF